MQSYYIPSESKIQQLKYIISLIEKNCPNDVKSIEIINNELVCEIKKDRLLKFVEYIKDNNQCLFKQLVDITAVDYPSLENRFVVVYHFLSLIHNFRIRIKVSLAEFEPIESLTYLYHNADWLERELWDMFGVYVVNHNDLRRILTDFGFDGNPLKKDFPLTGFSEVAYDELSDKVIYKPVELMQTFRDFSYRNPWMDNIQEDTFKSVNRNLKDED